MRAVDSSLDVFVASRRAGALYRSDVEEDTFLFSYAGGTPDRDAVSLTMPVVRDPYDVQGTVHPVFEMNLPEGALREKLRLLFAKAVAQFDDLALLGIVGQSQVGRLRYARAGHAPGPVPAQDVGELLAHDGAHDLFAELLDTYAHHSGVSGVQPKVLLRAAAGARHAAPERVTTHGATHIVKSFDPDEYPELAANEYLCMRAARLAGLPTANVALSKNRRLLVVERFDRRPGGGYLGLEDLCVLSGLRAHGRYEGSYELVAKRVREFASPAHQQTALEQLFAMVALACAVENGDAHLKNFAVLYDDPEGEVWLAPAYDVVSTTPFRPRDVLALTLGGSKDFPDRKRLVAFGRQACGLGARACEAALARVVTGVRKAMPAVRRLATGPRELTRIGAALLAAWERGTRRLTR